MTENAPVFLPSRALPTPPDSPRKRRRHLRESEETNGEMSLEQYLYRSDPYRSTSIAHPLPYPLTIKPAADSIRSNVSQYHTSILEILNTYGFSGECYISVDEVTKPNYPGGEKPTVILRIQYLHNAILPLVLGEARDHIHNMLLQNGVSLDIEIVDLQNCFQPSLFIIQPDDPTVGPYEEAREGLIQLLTRELSESWRTLCLFNVGSSESKAIAAIVIFIDPQTYCDWTSLQRSILQEVRQFLDATISLGVEFLPGGASFVADISAQTSVPPETHQNIQGAEPKSMLDLMDGIGRLQMGMSIGLKGEQGGGTMGGFVTIQRGDIISQGILTNYHVVRPSTPMVTDTDRKGISFGHSNCPTIEVIYPVTKDAKKTQEEAQDNREILRKRLEYLIERENNYNLIERKLSHAELGHLTDTEAKYWISENALQAVKDMPIKIGNVLYASGLGVMGSSILDWAFVEITEPGVKKFFRRGSMPNIPRSSRPNRYEARDVLESAGTPLWGFQVMRKGAWYCMVGRTTEEAGVCNGALASCHWRKDEARYDEAGNKVILAEVTHEYVVLNKQLYEYDSKQSPFCHSGDSGSFIINADGYVCGLLYGYLCSSSGPIGTSVNAGLVTCMGDVQKSVEALATPRDIHGRPIGVPAKLSLPELQSSPIV